MISFKKAKFTLFSVAFLISSNAFATDPAPIYPRISDMDGDGKDDVGIFHWMTGNWYYAGSESGPKGLNWGGRHSRPVLGDFDGDGKTDPAVFYRHAGQWIIFQTATNTVRKEVLGDASSFPIPADYDGDGIQDLAVFDGVTGIWLIKESSTGKVREEQFGAPVFRPVPADFDGDGKADLALYNRITGYWFIRSSFNGELTRKQFGHRNARPVVGDYDGDGIADIAVYDRQGHWTILQSSEGFYKTKFGFPGVQPIPADYDGDGKTDLAIFHRNRAHWYIMESKSGNPRNFAYGWSMATPLQSYQNGGIEGGVILAFGDSITFGRGSASNGPNTGYPMKLSHELEAAFGGMYRVVNSGVPGETTVGGNKRFAQVFNSVRPELVLLMEGTNDQFYGYPYSLSIANLDQMSSYARSQGADVILAKIAPVRTQGFSLIRSLQASRVSIYNQYVENLARSRNFQVADIYRGITSFPNWSSAAMDPGSANHPNDLGYQIVANTFRKAIRQAKIRGLLY